MRRHCLTMLLAVPSFLGAQEAVTLDQSLGFNYHAVSLAQGAYGATSSLQQASYNLSLGLPIVEYRLGAASLSGALDYLRERTDSAQDSSLGLRSVGVSGSLFPYQPYHVNFDFSRYTSPALFGGDPEKSQTFGLGLSYTGAIIQQAQIDYRHGEVSGALGKQDWSSFRLKGAQTYSDTILNYRADHMAFGSQGGLGFASSNASMDARTQLSRDWTVQESLSSYFASGNKSYQAGTSLMGNTGGWTSVSGLTANYFDVLNQSGSNLSVDQSLARTWGKLSTYGQVGLSGQRGDGAGSGLAENVTLGAAYQVAQGWFLSGDGGMYRNGAQPVAGGSGSAGNTATSLHLGLSWGGGIPEILKHALFYWSDLRLQSSIQANYPPGYIPPELAAVLLDRRMRREGSTQFTSDITHLQSAGGGQQDWARISGSLLFQNGAMLRIFGDWRDDQGLIRPGLAVRDNAVSANGSFNIPMSIVNMSWGHSHTDASVQATPAAVSSTFSPYLLGMQSGSRTFASIGLDSWAGGLPWGVLLMRNTDLLGLQTTTLSTHVSTSFRNVACGISFSQGWQSNGIRNSQVNVTLRRWFDTIALWGLEN